MTKHEAGSSGACAPGLLCVVSPSSVAETVERLKRAIEAGGMTLFSVVDHSEGAQSVGLTMNDTQVLIFGNPKGGTPAMAARPLLAFELPLKVLVWDDGNGQVRVAYQDAAELGRRYQVPAELMTPLSGVGGLVRATLEG
ncbi:DUF302 domain-containing protein [Streptomyces sp. NPDC056165]|uniref:DUF302 domain-containing protein n=1 Tax=Streptomyces sp. NPDC056165 TaxID=3345733 RepID=UPI0035D9043B